MINKSSMVKAVQKEFTDEQIASLVFLFKIAPESTRCFNFIEAEKALDNGFLFIDKNGQIVKNISSDIFNSVNDRFGNGRGLFNETFYRSFSTVRDASMYQLLFDQILHYFSTYGAESLGIKVPTYIPIQDLKLPKEKFNKDFKITVIRILPDNECVTRLDSYLKTLTAPSPQILSSVKELLSLTTIVTDDIKSFEVQVVKHDMDGTVPSNPVSQLRYLVYRTTNQTLIIKNRYMRDSIKNSPSRFDTTAHDIITKCSIEGLASIFLRYKPIFLAFKSHKDCAPLINNLRRKAEIYHKPLPLECLQNLTSIKDINIQRNIIAKASNRDLVKVLNSLNSHLDVDLRNKPQVYAIRNGRTFVNANKEFTSGLHGYALKSALINELQIRLTPYFKDKTFYIPSYIDYAVPTTEKQFVGNIPFGTKIIGAPNDAFTVGIHWFNGESQRADIDLHLNSATQHFGWNGCYRDSDDILYTGDHTNAPLPNGAAEAYWFNPVGDSYILSANLYSGPINQEFKLFMTKVKPDNNVRQNRSYTYDPNEALFSAIPLKYSNGDREMNIGMFVDNVFYLYGGGISNGIVPQGNYGQFIEGLTAQLQTKMSLNSLLEICGANVITDISHLTTEELDNVISLAPEDLSADTLLSIIDKQ